jgi:hypothetical protein
MSRRKRNKYIGSWTETPCEKVELPFTIESLRSLLSYGAGPDSPYTHQQIADWANRFWWECTKGSLSESSDPKLSAAAEIALDADAQWELFLVNTYSLEELQHLDFSSVRLPHDWFDKWDIQLRKIVA